MPVFNSIVSMLLPFVLFLVYQKAGVREEKLLLPLKTGKNTKRMFKLPLLRYTEGKTQKHPNKEGYFEKNTIFLCGSLTFGLGTLGIFLPFLPTTVFTC